jgi:hypothetical protein
VTGFATWSTSDASIATVDSVGFVTFVRAGRVAIRAAYQDTSNFIIWDGQPGGTRRYYRALSGRVRDAADNSIITAAEVRIIDGPNRGRFTSTGTDGAYQLYDLELGTFTVRFLKGGYVTRDLTYTITGDKFNGLDASLTRSP